MVGCQPLLSCFPPIFCAGASGGRAWLALGYVTILALMGTVLVSYHFFKLVQGRPLCSLPMIGYLVPIVALSWGAFRRRAHHALSPAGHGVDPVGCIW